MLELGPPDLLTGLGSRLSKKSRSFVLLVALGSLFISVTIGAIIVQKSSFHLAKYLGINKGISKENPLPLINSFYDRHQRANGKAYQAFFDLGLSNINFISKYSKIVNAGDHKFEYKYLELWVNDDFSFKEALAHFQSLVCEKVKGVSLEAVQVDAKAYRVTIKLDGVETHKIIFSKTGMESENDADKLAMVDVNRRIPKINYSGPAKIVIIIDDIGHRAEIETQFLRLPVNLTFAILPHSPSGVEFANLAHSQGHEIMLHLPMEPKAYPNIRPGKGGLLLRMGPEELLSLIANNISLVPHISGVNNHMGSAFTSNSDKMRIVLAEIGNRGLYFVDSRTAGSALGYETAKKLGVLTAARNVFLDHDPRPASIARQFDLMVKIALRKGFVIAIGHPHAATLQVLREKIPSLKTLNVVVVSPSKVVN